jgi:hypothetical protein
VTQVHIVATRMVEAQGFTGPMARAWDRRPVGQRIWGRHPSESACWGNAWAIKPQADFNEPFW